MRCGDSPAWDAILSAPIQPLQCLRRTRLAASRPTPAKCRNIGAMTAAQLENGRNDLLEIETMTFGKTETTLARYCTHLRDLLPRRNHTI